MPTKDGINDVTADFAVAYSQNHGKQSPSTMTQPIDPAFSSLTAEDRQSSYDDYTERLTAVGVTKLLGMTQFSSSRTWQGLSDAAFNADNA